MFDIGWTEMLVVVVVAIIVIGPKDLPRTLRTVGGFVRKIRSMARDFQGQIDEMVRESELDDVRKELNKISSPSASNALDQFLDEDGSIADTLKDTAKLDHGSADPTGPAKDQKAAEKPAEKALAKDDKQAPKEEKTPLPGPSTEPLPGTAGGLKMDEPKPVKAADAPATDGPKPS